MGHSHPGWNGDSSPDPLKSPKNQKEIHFPCAKSACGMLVELSKEKVAIVFEQLLDEQPGGGSRVTTSSDFTIGFRNFGPNAWTVKGTAIHKATVGSGNGCFVLLVLAFSVSVVVFFDVERASKRAVAEDVSKSQHPPAET